MMATDTEETIIGLTRCLLSALGQYGGQPMATRQLLDDLKFQLTELDAERRAMNNGTWRHKEPAKVVVQEEDMEEKEVVKVVTPPVVHASRTNVVEPKVVFQTKNPQAQKLVEEYLVGIGITPKERHVARLVIAGLSTFAISEILMLTEKTVKHHVANIFVAANVSSRPQLCAEAFGYTIQTACECNDYDVISNASSYNKMRKANLNGNAPSQSAE